VSMWINQLGECQKAASDADHYGDLHLGYAGARLFSLSCFGIPVQPGFIIRTETCNFFHENGVLPPEFDAELENALKALEKTYCDTTVGKKLPLFLTARATSKSRVAGVVSPIYHLGMNAENTGKIATLMKPSTRDGHEASSDQKAGQQLMRFLYQFTENALNITPDVLEDLFDEKRSELGYESDNDFSMEEVIAISQVYKEQLKSELGFELPDDLLGQLRLAVINAIKSWMSRRAIMQRQIHEISDEEGLAIIVRAAAFADFDDMSGQAYLDTRDRTTGENKVHGGLGWNLVGEQSARTSRFSTSLSGQSDEGDDGEETLIDVAPEIHARLTEIGKKAEHYFGRCQRLGFIIQSGEPWVGDSVDLQLTATAELKTNVDFVNEGILTKEQALCRIDPLSLEQIMHPSIRQETEREVIASGVPASPGAASGEIVFSSEDAIDAAREGRKTILVRVETSPEDVHGMQRTEGVLTIRGGMTSHAAVIARGMGRPCVCGAGNMRIDLTNETLFASGQYLKKGDIITLDGAKGEVLLGEVAMEEAILSDEFQQLMSWADEARRMEVRTNAEMPSETLAARQFGAEGIGLCRTEHMFFDESRILTMREMILSETEAGRRAALDKLLPMQRSDFIELFEAANGQPVTIRLLDPPLHEFLPKADEEIAHTAKAMGVDDIIVRRRIDELSEFNPMLGHRGCRLAISYPEITEMQARAILQAAIIAAKNTGAPVMPEIMVPLVALKKELDFVKERINSVAEDVMKEMDASVQYLVGTMIELPRAVIRADAIADSADFFSFGTNDMTQMMYGISRDDASPFLKTYRQKTIIDEDPFVTLDIEGVGELVKMAARLGRENHPDLKLGVCGEHGGDPVSVKFFDRIGLDYVSCSPFRVPIAKLAAAQASIEAKNHTEAD
jgi:pyruvate,orthophosphate dikinase